MISRPCACVPSLLNLPPTSPHPTALGYHRAPDLSSLHRTVDFRGLSGFTCDDVYVSMLLSQFSHSLPPSSAPPTSLLSMSASPLLPCKHVHHNHLPRFHVCCCLVTPSCLTLCDPMDCGTPCFPILHHLPELTQIHVHRVSDAIQTSHPLSSPSPPAFSLSQHQGLFQ